jgi:hypothetical protein
VIHPTLDLAINTHSPACTLDVHGAALALDAHRTAARLHLDPIHTDPLVLDTCSAALALDAHGTTAHLRLDPIHADPQFFGSLVVDGENDRALGVREHAIAARVRGDFAHPAPSWMSRMSGVQHLLLGLGAGNIDRRVGGSGGWGTAVLRCLVDVGEVGEVAGEVGVLAPPAPLVNSLCDRLAAHNFEASGPGKRVFCCGSPGM